MLDKLRSLGMNRSAVQWFRSYLTMRTQSVCLMESCLSPSLYLSWSVRVAYLALYYLSSTYMTYLWGFKVVASSFMLTIRLSILQACHGLSNVLSWFHAYLLIINLEKTKIIPSEYRGG